MKFYLLTLVCTIAAVRGTEHFPDHFRLGMFFPVNQQPDNQRKSETLSSGAIRDVIERNSPRYRKELIRNSNPNVDFANEDSHVMTSRAKYKLDVLANLFMETYHIRVKVLLAWTDAIDNTDLFSLHYEGRALRIQSSDGRRELLSELGRLSIEAGFNWVHYAKIDYIHVSVHLDTKDHTPTFPYENYTAHVKENVPIMTKVITLTATDEDTGSSGEIIYGIVSQIPAAHFSIDSKTGEVFTTHKIDYEQHTTYILTVEARDNGTPPRSSRATVIILIVDMNDNYPVMKTFRTSIDEDADVGTEVGMVMATDKDSGLNGEVWFKMASLGFPFSVSSNGLVTVSERLDREARDSYDLRVNASDKGSPPLSTTGVNFIHILDVNDNAPVFTKSHYYCTVVENSSNTTFVCNVTATDNDIGENARLSYIIRNANMYFKISETSGKVTVLTPIDREETPKVDMNVIATDHGTPSLRGEAYLHVKVLDVNDNKPFCTDSTYSFTLIEEGPNGTVVGEIEATDKDEGSNADVSFELVDGHVFDSKPRFYLTESKNKATLKAHTLDYEERNHYTITVGVTDHGNPPLSSQCRVRVKLIDINDNAPVLSRRMFYKNINESAGIGTYVLQVTATDKDSGDNAVLSYNIISGNERSDFKINTETGVLTTTNTLHYKTKRRYSFNISVSDNGKPKLSVSGLVIVTVRPAKQVACETTTKLDLTFVVDTSGSIGWDNFKIMQQFLKNLVDYFKVGKDETQIALMGYSRTVDIEAYLNTCHDNNCVNWHIDNLWYQGAWTNTGDALYHMVEDVFQRSVGMRDLSIPKVGILLTDGYSNYGISIWRAVRRIKEVGFINMFVIGIGHTFDERGRREINLIASAPLKSHIFKIRDFHGLASSVARLGKSTCYHAAELPICSTIEADIEGGSFKDFRVNVNLTSITIEVRDRKGMSFMYVSFKDVNPGPDSDSKDVYKVEGAVSPRSITLKAPSTEKENIVYIAVQGQEEENKFILKTWGPHSCR